MLPESPDQPGRSLPPGHCPRCHRVNLLTVQACLWCQCPLTPSVVLPNKRNRLPLLGVVALIAGVGVVGGGVRMIAGRSEPDRNLTAAQATTLTRPAASPASSATPPTSTPPSGSTAPGLVATPTAIPPQQLVVEPAPVVRKRKVRQRIVRRVVARQDSQAEAAAPQTQADTSAPTMISTRSFAAEVDEWVTQIYNASDPSEERRIGRLLFAQKSKYERAGAFRRAQVMERLLLAMETRHAPNPVVQQSWTAYLGVAQTTADQIDRDRNSTPAQHSQESRDLSQKMLDWERQAGRRAPPRR